MRFNKRLAAGVCSVALASGLAAVAAPSADAAYPKVDSQNRSVTCNDIIGKIKFMVPLTLGGVTPNSVTLTVKSTDCIDNDFGPFDASVNTSGVTIKQYVAKGILASDTNDCLGLQGLSEGTSGNVIGTFATVAGTPGLLPNKNTLSVSQTYGGVYNDGGLTTRTEDSNGWGAQYGFFYIGPADAPMPGTDPANITGAYADDDGDPLVFAGTTAQSSGSLATACFTTGIKGIQFGIGGLTT